MATHRKLPRKEETKAKRPKPTTKHLGEVKNSFDDYTKKLAEFKKPTYKPDDKK
ncbi:MAG: hypothetical protein ACYSWO_29905 [Planctomycetota bacterium]